MAKKPPSLSEKKKSELKGFEEVVDLLKRETREKKPTRTPRRDSRRNTFQIEDYEIFDFLEKENARLKKLDQFFATQMPLMRKYPQTEGLIQKERNQTEKLKEELIEKFQQPDSSLIFFLDDLFKKSF